MSRYDDLHAHFSYALHNRIKVVHFKPQQHTVSVRPIVTITNRAVMVLHTEPVQLKNKLSIRHQLLVFRAPMITLAAQQTLIPSAARFYIGYGDEWLWTHVNQRNKTAA